MRRLFILFFIPLVALTARENLSEDSEFLDIYFEVREDGGYDFYADNSHFIPQSISLGFESLVNLSMESENPTYITLKPGEKGVLITSLIQIDKKRSYSFRSRLSYTNGDPDNTKPDDYLYLFPYKHGSKYKLDQGYGGKFSHRDENFYALDFSMDVGTPIYAARGGVVVEVKEDSNRRGTSKAFAKYGNYIVIYHSDGTFASYVHLKKNGAEVSVGDRVKEGDFIGYSGNTGLTTGPHLHFSVNIPSKTGVRESIPIFLRGKDGKSVDPKVGTYYYSYHEGKKEFEEVFGKDLKNDDYTGYIKNVKESKKLAFRTEEVDDATVIYCSNGYNKEVKGKVLFALQNSEVSRELPIDIEIPPLSEIFVCLVKPKDSSKPFKFSYSIRYQLLK